jgi:DNA topoisomerase VI subunit B
MFCGRFQQASSILENAEDRFLQIAREYAWLNPHMTLSVDWFGGDQFEITATDPSWIKWKPSDPTSPHWYTAEHLERLIAGYLKHDKTIGRDRTVRELVAEFRGLSGSAKQKAVLEATGLSRAPLSQLVKEQAIDREAVEAILTAMKAESRPVKPDMLGIIGKQHFEMRFAEAGYEMETFDYRREMAVDDGVPWVLESAFGYCPGTEEDEHKHSGRHLITGINWSPGIINPFRTLGRFGSLDSLLSEQYVRWNEPVIMVLHLACARVEYTDRGKSAVVLT